MIRTNEKTVEGLGEHLDVPLESSRTSKYAFEQVDEHPNMLPGSSKTLKCAFESVYKGSLQMKCLLGQIDPLPILRAHDL